ncbi:HECT-domain (ubiquitin-transferase) domain-containing protein [Sarocladium implicatum]|nr:HECT-domain (ubiquitin-transferase) domain-containing protein [Sarocladium implicatum]
MAVDVDDNCHSIQTTPTTLDFEVDIYHDLAHDLDHNHSSWLLCWNSEFYVHNFHDSFTCYHPSSFSSFQSLMSPRITRSSARQAASKAAAQSSSSTAAPAAAAATTATAAPSHETPLQRTADSTPGLKRKATVHDTPGPSAPSSGSSGRKHKRQRVPDPPAAPSPSIALATSKPRRKDRRTVAAMDNQEGIAGSTSTNENTSHPASASSSRKSSRSKRPTASTVPEASSSTSLRRSKRSSMTSADQDTAMGGMDDRGDPGPPPPPPISDPVEQDSDDDSDEAGRALGNRPFDEDEDDDDDDDDPFGGFGGPGGPMSGISNTLRALSGMMSGLASRLRELLNNLRQDDLSVQLIALQELSELLLVSNEDNLSGHFSPDAFVKELVQLMNKEESPEVMLLACRCLANLMEALPASVANVVYGNAVPVLCQKLLEISFIDLAEQALSTLEKISLEYPASIVREGGLTACLSYLDFFATSTQRTAVTTAANCCRNIPEDSFPVVRDVMPTLLNVLNSNDQRVVEQAALCVSGIVESFKYHPSKLEELVSVDLLRAVLRLLVPGTTNLISSNIHTQFLRVLAFSARASPRLSTELIKLNVVETLYQILTGVSPPSGTEDVASKLDSVIVMQALIHRPREQIIETLNVVCELLPSLPKNADPALGEFVDLHGDPDLMAVHLAGRNRRGQNDKRIELLKECKDEVRRFALIIFPTLTDAFSSTVNLTVRQKVLTAQLKMLSNLDEKILAEALISVPYASFLASILSQQDHSSLVMLGLQATELLLSRLDNIYRYQFYREGVINEITKLANEEEPAGPPVSSHSEDEDGDRVRIEDQSGDNEHSDDHSARDPEDEEDEDEEHDRESRNSEDEDGENDDDDDQHDEHEQAIHHDEMSPVSSQGSTMSLDGPPHRHVSEVRSVQSRIRSVAQRFLETHDQEGHGKAMKEKATIILDTLTSLAGELEGCYLKRTMASQGPSHGKNLFTKLASYFDTDVLESVTSAELLASGLVRVLLEVFSNPDEALARQAQATFLEVFMSYTVKSKPKTATADSPNTPFSVMIHKLQDLLSRSEHFEVMTVHQNAFDGNRSSPASMLGKQIRLRLVADDDSDIPRSYRNIMVSIHAIATFKSLDDYLRPRISLSERPRGNRRDGLTRALAAMAGSAGMSLSNVAAARAAADRLAAQYGSHAGPPPPPAAPTPSASRATRRSKGRSAPQPETPSGAEEPAESSHEKAILRKSSRRHGSAGSEAHPPSRPPPTGEDEPQDTLECADEKQLTDEEDEHADTSALDAIVGSLDEDMKEEPTADPSAVNMEVATGGNVTARKEDGTKVPTPLRSTPQGQNKLAPPGQATPTPGTSSTKPLSYASALQTAPKDWHIEFSVDTKVIPNETTIYRAVHSSTTNSEDQLTRSIWSNTHPVKFRRVPGPAPAESLSFGSSSDSEAENEGGIPTSLAKHLSTAAILRLLKILHDLNANTEDVLIDNRNNMLDVHVEPLSQFVNTKLTAKLNRQLEEPLIVASNCLPSWSEDLARLYPFLFPFETRHLFLQSTSFGYARSMARWQNAQTSEDSRRDRNNDRPFLGRLQRQKVRISRTKILESALKVMDLYGASQSILEVEYFEEVGTGLGPTLEFYSTVSQEFSKKKLKLWREMDSTGSDEFVGGQNGLFPRPLSDEEATTPNGERIVHLFKMLGKFVARSMLDSRIIDLHFSPIFFRIGETAASGIKPSLGAVKIVDPGLARSLKTIKKFAMAKKEIDEDPERTPAQKVADAENVVIDDVRLDDLCLDFTLPGYPNIELQPNGSHERVTIENVETYLEKVIDMTLGAGVRRQVDAFRAGFTQVFPYSALSAFTPDELVNLFGRVDEDWSIETLLDSIKADHGYNMDSQSVRNLLQTMSSFEPVQRREFLQFITGSPKLPIGGFKSLTPMFTVVCKPSEHPYTSDDYLPSVMTCVNYLKLPNYTTADIMKKQLYTAMKEGQGAFHLS